MPPKAKTTKEMILDAVLEITRETGFETVNARSIADRLQCSTRPIFTCYKNMEDLKREFLDFAYEYYTQYVFEYNNSAKVKACLLYPLSYLEFAQNEPNLFKLLFISDMDLNMADANDFYNEIGNEKRAESFAETIGVDTGHAKVIFLNLFLYTHGMAVLAVGKKLVLDRDRAEKMLIQVLSAFIKQEKPDYDSLI